MKTLKLIIFKFLYYILKNEYDLRNISRDEFIKYKYNLLRKYTEINNNSNKTYHIGDKFKCKKTILNVFENPLFIKGNIYEILDIDDNNTIYLNHILYGSEYGIVNKDFIRKNFKKI